MSEYNRSRVPTSTPSAAGRQGVSSKSSNLISQICIYIYEPVVQLRNNQIIHFSLLLSQIPPGSHLSLGLPCTLVIPTLSPPWQGIPVKDFSTPHCTDMSPSIVHLSPIINIESTLTCIHARLFPWLGPNTMCSIMNRGDHLQVTAPPRWLPASVTVPRGQLNT